MRNNKKEINHTLRISLEVFSYQNWKSSVMLRSIRKNPYVTPVRFQGADVACSIVGLQALYLSKCLIEKIPFQLFLFQIIKTRQISPQPFTRWGEYNHSLNQLIFFIYTQMSLHRQTIDYNLYKRKEDPSLCM